jgi:glycine cleavage system H protein
VRELALEEIAGGPRSVRGRALKRALKEERDMDVPEDLRYSRDARVGPGGGRGGPRGITDFAQDALGDVVYVDVPEVGTEVTAGQPFGEVESTKSVSDVYAP